MPTKRRRMAREAVPELSDSVLYFLSDGLYGSAAGFSFKAFMLQHPGNREEQQLLWRQHGDLILREWIEQRPGTRPALWWKFDAPRISPEDHNWKEAYFVKGLPDPRRRVGGTGDPIYIRFTAIVPEWPYGIPIDFITRSGEYDDDEEDRIGQPIDAADPPRYESQAAYLRRHRVLTPAEKRRLRARDFKPQLVTENEENGR